MVSGITIISSVHTEIAANKLPGSVNLRGTITCMRVRAGLTIVFYGTRTRFLVSLLLPGDRLIWKSFPLSTAVAPIPKANWRYCPLSLTPCLPVRSARRCTRVTEGLTESRVSCAECSCCVGTTSTIRECSLVLRLLFRCSCRLFPLIGFLHLNCVERVAFILTCNKHYNLYS